MDDFWNEVIDEYVAECSELLEDMECELISTPLLDKDLAEHMFRPLHSFKGSSASLGFDILASVTHNAENLLSFFHKELFQSDENKYVEFFLEFSDFLKESFSKVLVEKNDKNCKERGDIVNEKARGLISEIEKELGGGSTGPSVSCTNPSKKEALSESDEAEEIIIGAPEDRVEQQACEFLDDELINAFVQESKECFAIVEDSLMKLIIDPHGMEPLRNVFRYIHSFKGNCGIFAFSDLEILSHRIETLLDLLIEGKLHATKSIFEAVLPFIDIMQEAVVKISNKEAPIIEGIQLHLDLLDSFMITPKEIDDNAPLDIFADAGPSITDEIILDEKLDINLNEKAIETVKKTGEEIIVPDKVKAPLKQKRATIKPAQRNDIRVDLTKLDSLNNLVGELVTVKTMVLDHLKSGTPWEDSEKTFRMFDRVASELQDISMEIRMVPVEGLFKKMVRIVHDISKKVNKKIEFNYYGEDTEIDKTIIEKISDPLVHMIRNSVDHGIESSEIRSVSGKPEAGKVSLTAKNESGEIRIIIEDDGGGINPQFILNKARESGIIDDDGPELTEEEIFSLLFAPGFSTAKEVTDISGRGVGMDVVKSNIESVKGTIETESVLGKGTKFTIKIPLTLAIVQGMLFSVGSNQFIIPIEVVSECVKVSDLMLTKPMEDSEMVTIRDQIIPVMKLTSFYHIPNAIEDTANGILVVVENHGRKVALLVDELIGQREIVVKPIPSLFKNVQGISGCSIMGDGAMSLIIDTSTLLAGVSVASHFTTELEQ